MNKRLEIYNSVKRLLSRFVEQRLPVQQKHKSDDIAAQLIIDGEERRDSGQSSINRAKMNLNWLEQNIRNTKSQEHCKFQRSFLDGKQSVLHEKIDVFLGSQKHLINTVSTDTVDPSIYRALIIDYIKQCLTIMLLQKTIFQREVEISEELAVNVKEFMRTMLKQFQNKDPEKMMAIAQTMKVLNEGQINLNELKSLNYQQMNQGLAQFQSKLENRQGELNHVAQAVKEVQEFVKQNQKEFDENPEESVIEQPEPSSTSRMAQAKRVE